MKNLSLIITAICICTSATAMPSKGIEHLQVNNGKIKTFANSIKSVTRSMEEPKSEFVATEANFCPSGTFMNGTGGYWLLLSNAGLDKESPTHSGQMVRIFIMSAPR